MNSTPSSSRLALFIIGIILVLASAITFAVAPILLYFFGLPIIVFAIGAILIALSDRSVKAKLLWIFSPAVACVLASFVIHYVLTESSRIEPETFLLPENYRGKVQIVYSPCGEKAEYENGRRLYRIPENGVLVTQFEAEYGIVDHQFFFVDANGKRTPLEETYAPGKGDQPGVYGLGTGHSPANGSEPETHFQEFFVGSEKEQAGFYEPQYENLRDSVEQAVLKACRGK